MPVFKDFDEIKSAVGTEVGVSDWVMGRRDGCGLFLACVSGDISIAYPLLGLLAELKARHHLR